MGNGSASAVIAFNESIGKRRIKSARLFEHQAREVL